MTEELEELAEQVAALENHLLDLLRVVRRRVEMTDTEQRLLRDIYNDLDAAHEAVEIKARARGSE